MPYLFLLLTLCLMAGAVPGGRFPDEPPEIRPEPSDFPDTTRYPLPNLGNIAVHDPSILTHNGNFYLFRGGIHIPFFKAPNISGPWTTVGTVLDGPSVIHKGNRNRPWAPTTIQRNGTFYCFYAVTHRGSQDSAIGVATSNDVDHGDWTDHGALINTGAGHLSHLYPYRESNAIDPSFITDQQTGKPFLIYGSYWHGIFQIPLSNDLLSVEEPHHPLANHLAFIPGQMTKRQEGPFMSYKDSYYYLWFSHGKCCQFVHGFPPKKDVYQIRVGRSKDVSGPFVDRDGRKLLQGGGTVVYASNHRVVYAPGGLGVLPGTGNRSDILYYHYLNTTIGFTGRDAQLGWNYLDYVDGWPFPLNETIRASVSDPRAKNASSPQNKTTLDLLLLSSLWICMWLCESLSPRWD